LYLNIKRHAMADQYADVCYGRNFVVQVIVRVDFLSPLPWAAVGSTFPKQIRELALTRFPIFEGGRELVERTFEFKGADTIAGKAERFQEWRFSGKAREKVLSFLKQAVVLEYKTYGRYEVLREEFEAIVPKLMEVLPELQPSRLGLRYINNIDLDEPNPLEWAGLIDDSLLGLLCFYPQKRPALSRVFHTIDYTFDEGILHFQFGIHNPDHPAPIKRKQFILDLDAYQGGALDNEMLGKSLDLFHVQIQDVFERSIGPALKEKMR
jgi:uncharacterized protein (TIGR04255 family)